MSDPAAAETLPAGWYHRPDIFARERDVIHRAAWWLIGPEAALTGPGARMAADAGGWPVIALRGEDGKLGGFHNVCRHRAGPLMREGENARAGKFLVCRYHGWRYHLNGALCAAPGLTDSAGAGTDGGSGCADFSQLGLYPVRVAAWNGLLFAAPDEAAPAFEDWLGGCAEIARRFPGPGAQGMAFQTVIERTAKTNWKAYADNSCEGYHVDFIHKALGGAMESGEADITVHKDGQFVGFDVTYTPTAEDPSRAGRGYWIYKYPGLLMHFSEYAFNAETVIPKGPGEILLRRWFWIDAAAARARGVRPETAPEQSARVVDEDIGICEAVQRNLEAGVYQSGVLAPGREPGTAYIQSLTRAALEA